MTADVGSGTTEAPGAMAIRVSIVIPNYNYAEFLTAAIDSALSVDWPFVEVIVVDDGSTDRSRVVIEGYRDRIVAIFQKNGGQNTACNAGFARAHGDVVFFLDSDDTVDPTIVRELARVWRPGISKVQFQMRVIDAVGRATGAVFPQYIIAPTPQLIKQWVLGAFAYPTPPGSGNAYAREFLEKIFPLEGTDRFNDSYCLPAAPYLGDVVTIAKPLVGYRIHGRNDGAMSSMDVKRFAIEVERALRRFAYGQRIARSVGVDVPEHVVRLSMTLLAYRLASLRLAPGGHPIAGDSRIRILRDTVKASFVPQGVALAGRVALLVWTILVIALPLPLARRLVLWRFSSSSRPQTLLHLLRQARILTGRHDESKPPLFSSSGS